MHNISTEWYHSYPHCTDKKNEAPSKEYDLLKITLLVSVRACDANPDRMAPGCALVATAIRPKEATHDIREPQLKTAELQSDRYAYHFPRGTTMSF